MGTLAAPPVAEAAEESREAGDHAASSRVVTPRTAHPHRDTEVIDSRAARTNQAVIGSLALAALLLGAATLAFVGVPALGWGLALLVAGLALLAAATGLRLGCEAYLLVARPRGLRLERHPA